MNGFSRVRDARALHFVARAQPSSYELVLQTTALDGLANRRLDQAGQRLAFSQHALGSITQSGLDPQ
jgi:hypothetical protein